MDLDSILNFVIPAAILMFGIFYFYKLLKEPIDKLGGFIKGLIFRGSEKVEEKIGDEDWRYYPRR